jgi:hypothetical protein
LLNSFYVANDPVTFDDIPYKISCLSVCFPKKYKNEDIQNYNVACCFVWVETWSLTLREERRPRVFENKLLRKIFGPKEDEETGE